MVLNICNLDENLVSDHLLGKLDYTKKYDKLSMLCVQYIIDNCLSCTFQKLKFDILDNNVHIGIVPKYKKNSNYKKLFTDFNSNFYGISFNVIHSLSSKYAMLSYGSWNHMNKISFPVVVNKFQEFNIAHHLNKIVNSKQITIFIQKYCKKEYWFGWDDNDIIIWMNNEKKTIHELLKYIDESFTLRVKFHPKMDAKYINYFKENIGYTDIKYLPLEYSLKQVAIESYCCIVNSGFSAIELCILGSPMLYLNDSFSCIPMIFYGIKGFHNIMNFTIDDLPDQNVGLDYFASQIFHVNDIPNIIFQK